MKQRKEIQKGTTGRDKEKQLQTTKNKEQQKETTKTKRKNNETKAQIMKEIHTMKDGNIQIFKTTRKT